MVASDRSLGGFGHQKGEDQPKVKTKKRLLEEEGVGFEEDGKKIRTEYFVASPRDPAAAVRRPASKPNPKSSPKGSNKRRAEERSDQAAAASPKRKSKYFETVTEETLKEEILNLLGKRQKGKTC